MASLEVTKKTVLEFPAKVSRYVLSPNLDVIIVIFSARASVLTHTEVADRREELSRMRTAYSRTASSCYRSSSA